MKTVIAFLFLVASAFAQDTVDVTLAWDRNLEPDLAFYRLYVGTAPQTYGGPISVGTNTKTLTLPRNVLHFAIVTAVNTSGLEGGPSNELCFQVFRAGEGVVPSNVTGLYKVGALQASIEQSIDLKLWTQIAEHTVLSHTPQAFYRMVLRSKSP